MSVANLQKIIQKNCDISDARNNGIYSICTLILKLRNLYKWEKNIEPWAEPEPQELLDWIALKEEYWETIEEKKYSKLPLSKSCTDPYDIETVNSYVNEKQLYYGAGYGHSLKSVFFLAEILEKREVEGFPVVILGREINRELSSPFAFSQEKTIFIRKEPLRYFFWDQLQEIQPSSKMAIHHAFVLYDLLNDQDALDRLKLREKLESIVDFELEAMIHHETGELQENPIDSQLLQQVVEQFPGTSIEFVVRGIKDILADTHPKGMIGHIVEQQKPTSLCFYMGFMDNLRKVLFPQILFSGKEFINTGNWQAIEDARKSGREENRIRAELLRTIFAEQENSSSEELKSAIESRIIQPLGLDAPS